MLPLFLFSLSIPFVFSQVNPATANLCTTPETLYTCYVSYLQKFGYSSDGGFLPPFELLNRQMRSHELSVICRDFDDLTSCLGSASTYCVSFNNFYAYVNRRYQYEEAMQYLQNHAFFEFVCGSGKQLFYDNQDCLQRSLYQIPLTDRMDQCGQTKIRVNDASVCPATLDVTSCVRQQFVDACGESAGVAACGAASNIERRLDFLDAACLTEMDVRCSSWNPTSIHVFIIVCFAMFLKL